MPRPAIALGVLARPLASPALALLAARLHGLRAHTTLLICLLLPIAAAATLQLACDCGAKYKAADFPLRLRMRTRLLKAGYIEDPTVDADLAIVLKQRDYLIQRQAGLLKKNGAMVDGFLDELKTMCKLEQGASATSTTFDAALVREASVVRGRVEPTLTVGADVARCGEHALFLEPF